MPKTIPKKKECKGEKWLSEQALQKSGKRRKGKGERERHHPTDTELLQRIARRDKKAFFM